MKPLLFSFVVIGYLQGCTGDPGTSFFLSTVVKPNPAACTYVATGDVPIEASGLFDPSFVQPYEIVVSGANLLDNSKADEVTSAGGGPPVKPETNTLTVRSFDVCYYVRTADPDYIQHLNKIKGDEIEEDNCTSEKLDTFDTLLPAYYESIPAQGVVPPSEDKASPIGVAIFGEIYSPQTLNILFGDAFNPAKIANLPDTSVDDTENTRSSNYFPTTSGNNRDASWGEWPQVRSHLNGVLETIIDIRAVAGTQTGTVIKSNWIQFPIKLQVKSRAAKVCGDSRSTSTSCPVEACIEEVLEDDVTTTTYYPCSCDGAGVCACADGPEGVTCIPDQRWIGDIPDFTGVCLPQQNREGGECKAVTCPAIGGAAEEEE